jgi:hypothetical protein
MEQLLLHLLGDYILQTNWMATEKTKRNVAAGAHALVYGIPFMLLGPSKAAFLTIVMTHYFIDRYRLARYVVFAKNWITEPSIKWSQCSATGYGNDVPLWLSLWLLIIADNTLHLCINYAALRWL